MTIKNCARYWCWYWTQHKQYRWRRLVYCFLCLIILMLLLILVIWLVLRPSKPRFHVEDATVSQFNLSDPNNFLSSVIQVSITSTNPNDRIGIYYDRLDVYAVYGGQRITDEADLSTGYQDHNDVNVWSTYLSGNAVPLAPYLVVAVDGDKSAGFMLIHIKIDGLLRWKVGTWVSGHYHIDVNCPVLFSVESGKGFRFQNTNSCSVDV